LHSATMVAAGVFLVARLYPLFQAAGAALPVIAGVGVVTSLLGGAALVETDLKRALAYSTMSQIGLMFVGLGSGSLLAGILLLVAQALYKATLFLAAGAVDRAVGGTAFERMGSLASRMPLTTVAFGLSAAALAGLPVTLALPPKDPVLAAAAHSNSVLFVVTLLASLFTALYSARIFGVAFLGAPSQAARQAREAKKGLLIPLLVMAALVPIGLLANAALLGQPLARLLGVAAPDAPTVMAITLGIAVIGVAVALYARRIWPEQVEWPVLRRVTPLFSGEFGLKALYRALAQASLWLVKQAGTCDRVVFDGFAEAVTQVTLAFVRACGRFDVRRIDVAVRDLGQGILALGQRVRILQTGRIENYVLVVFIWGLGVIAVAVLATLAR
jgi:NADH-quinone oxidoreductase subunit L